MTVLADFVLPPGLEAREPPEAHGVPRDGVRMLVSRRRTGEITHHAFAELPGLLLPGDLLVVNTSGTLPAAVRAGQLSVHFSTPLPDGSWLAELRAVTGHATQPYPGGSPGQELTLPGGALLTLTERVTSRLWRVDPGDLRTDMHQLAFPSEDISDRPLPESVMPAFRRLIAERLPSGRYRAADLMPAAAEAGVS